jgi:hypothetical protein
MPAPPAPAARRLDPEPYAPRVAVAGAFLVILGLALANTVGLAFGIFGALLLMASTYSRRDGWLLLGPLATWELTHAARRRQLYVLRVILTTGMLAFLAAFYNEFAGGLDRSFSGGSIPLWRAAYAAEQLFNGIAIGMAIIAVGGAILFFPPVIAEEREANRLDHLLVTDLRAREIILGKLAARVAVLAGYVILALPVLVVVTWLGGVDPDGVAIIAGLLAIGLFGVTGLAIGASVENTTSASAVAVAVVLVIAFLGLTAIAFAMSKSVNYWVANGRIPSVLGDPVVDGLRFVASGNPVLTAIRLGEARRAGGDGPAIVSRYAAWQAALFAVGWAAAVQRLRSERRPAAPGAAVATTPRRIVPVRPPVWDEPIFWHDVTTVLPGRQPNPGRFVRWMERIVIAAAIGLACLVLVAGWSSDGGRKVMREIAAMSGGIAVIALTIPVAFTTCRAIPRERVRGMLDSLRLTALTPAEILGQKWKAALAMTRPFFLIACVAWGLFVLAGGLHPAGAALLIAATAANRYLAASVGLWLGHSASTSARAVGRLLVFGVLYAYLIQLPAGLASLIGVNPRPIVFGLLPPVGQAVAGAAFEPRIAGRGWGPGVVMVTAASGFLFCAVASRLAWASACRRFDRTMTPEPDGAGRKGA